jgi:hypothetical protein
MGNVNAMSMKRIKRTLTTILVAAASAAVAAIAVSQAAPTPTRSSHAAKRSQAGKFSVLRLARLASSGTALPASIAKWETAPGALVSELELEPARSVPVEVNSTQLWVTPGRKGMCLSVPGSFFMSSGCGSLASADAGGEIMALWPRPGQAVIYGLVPDGASVTITHADGSSTAVPVSNNVFMRADSTPKSVSVRLAGGSVTTTPVHYSAPQVN